MNYCTYFKSTGKIYSLNPTPVETDELNYIEISFDLIGDFLSGKKQLFKYVVIPDDTTLHSGKIVEESKLNQHWSKREDILYKIPSCSEGELVITQDTKNKTCSTKISNVGLLTLGNKNVPNLTIAACVPGDPFTPLWVWNFEAAPEAVINYSGTDNIQFYTRRLLESYSHVII